MSSPKVVATTEHPGGVIVDPHNLIAFEDFPYTSQPWDSGWHAVTNPAHETYGEDGVIWSSVALQRQVDNTVESKVRSLVQELDVIIRKTGYSEDCLQNRAVLSAEEGGG